MGGAQPTFSSLKNDFGPGVGGGGSDLGLHLMAGGQLQAVTARYNPARRCIDGMRNDYAYTDLPGVQGYFDIGNVGTIVGWGVLDLG